MEPQYIGMVSAWGATDIDPREHAILQSSL